MGRIISRLDAIALRATTAARSSGMGALWIGALRMRDFLQVAESAAASLRRVCLGADPYILGKRQRFSARFGRNDTAARAHLLLRALARRREARGLVGPGQEPPGGAVFELLRNDHGRNRPLFRT